MLDSTKVMSQDFPTSYVNKTASNVISNPSLGDRYKIISNTGKNDKTAMLLIANSNTRFDTVSVGLKFAGMRYKIKLPNVIAKQRYSNA